MTTLETPEQELGSACRAGNLATVKSILAAYPSIDINHRFPDARNETSLGIACASGNAEIAMALMAHPGIDVNQPDDDSMTPLCRACKQGSLEIIKLLSENRYVDLNRPDEHGHSPLWFLIERGSEEGVEMLFSSGSTVINQYSYQPLELATFAEEKGFTRIAQMIRVHGKPFGPPQFL